VEEARIQDREVHRKALEMYSEEKTEWEQLKSLASGVLEKDHKAYLRALVDLSGLAELSDLGSSIHFKVHSRTLIEQNDDQS